MQEGNLTYPASRIHLFPVSFIVMPLFCCKTRMFGGGDDPSFSYQQTILLCVWTYINLNVMWMISNILNSKRSYHIYAWGSARLASRFKSPRDMVINHVWTVSLTCLPSQIQPMSICTQLSSLRSTPLRHWDPTVNWTETTKKATNNLVIIGYLCLKVCECLVASIPYLHC